ncbi:DUF3889 domain-containing protein [Peribacillus simplex]|uniref:DUF3889 domain-containing protein n=1 Tax=Peribacillus simplex TaxID=1478 RepID=A0A9W4KXP8_9BACI|nr:DUF3889 domain-containing protein [Peribacillus simplex]MDR4928436.1 DUF3889 domain-containing protein [Peribacillus simplex]WHX92186.1 DUF3889 domain-containing protein [Peribacillus simplex]CAH0198076.1 hypothetical protein SRABI133_01851 [Peribacillus simplex]
MKKVIVMLMGIFLIIQAGAISAQAQKPYYEKYGKIAITVLQADYPEVEINDYEYKGRKTVSKNLVEDDFRFLVDDKGQQFNVIVTVQHDLKNEKLLSLKVTEQKGK